MNSFLVESVSGMRTVKSLALESKFQKKWEDIAAEYTKASYGVSIVGGIAGNTSRIIHQLVDLYVLWLGTKLVIAGNISIGQLIAFRMLASRVSNPVLRIVGLWQEFQQSRVSLNRIADVFKVPVENAKGNSKLDLPEIKGDISFEEVVFRYSPSTPEAINNLSITIPRGKVVGIVGKSGAGKSTLGKLVQRLYVPERGKITIDSYDISMVDHNWIRRQIGVVLQESYLFNGTIKENISINKPMSSLEEVIRVSEQAGAHEFIANLPSGYDTLVGEKGDSLSGGQKQRIAIARALITDPKILILDEATSSLDYESERIIQENFKTVAKGRTVLIIAHRLSTLRDADYIAVMDKGMLIEYDTPNKLLEKKSAYYNLYTNQN